MSDTLPDALRHADTAQESIRAMTRVMPNMLTAPIASDALGELTAMGHLEHSLETKREASRRLSSVGQGAQVASEQEQTQEGEA